MVVNAIHCTSVPTSVPVELISKLPELACTVRYHTTAVFGYTFIGVEAVMRESVTVRGQAPVSVVLPVA